MCGKLTDHDCWDCVIAEEDGRGRCNAHHPLYASGRSDELAKIVAMRVDHRTLPHREFYEKWPDHRQYEEVLPSYCGCRDCQLWRRGS